MKVFWQKRMWRSAIILDNMFLWRCRESHQPWASGALRTAALWGNLIYFSLSVITGESREAREMQAKKKHNGQLQNWKSELQNDAISPSTVISRLEILIVRGCQWCPDPDHLDPECSHQTGGPGHYSDHEANFWLIHASQLALSHHQTR